KAAHETRSASVRSLITRPRALAVLLAGTALTLSPLVSRDAGSFTLAAPRRAPRGVGEPATMLGIEAGPPPCDAPTWTPPSLKEPASRDTSGVVRSGARRSAISR